MYMWALRVEMEPYVNLAIFIYLATKGLMIFPSQFA